jgi:L-ascorbate metabolism protein UlaG (beta-lactamase superfamily)
VSIEKKPAKNEIYFVWFNRYAGVTVKTPTKTLVIDPVDVKSRNFRNIDVVLITHEHYDHLDQPLVSEIQRMSRCMVIADSTSTRKLRNNIPPEKLTEVQPGSEVKLDKVLIRAERSNHPPAATPVSYIITSDDGVKIFHTSDSLPYPEMIEAGDKVDLVFCTVGIAPGASPETGFEIARLVEPKVAAPYHTGSVADQKKFAELLKKEMPRTTCLIPELGKIYQVSKKS